MFPGAGSNSIGICRVGSNVFFATSTPTTGFELWKSDGTAAGTLLVKDINIGSDGSSPGGAPGGMVAIGNTLYFVANDGESGNELWKSDGTESGTLLVKDIRAGSTGSSPQYLTAVGNTLFFVARDASGAELWKSDGTIEGTVQVKDIWPGSTGSSPLYLTAVGGTLFFVSSDLANGNELWKSDGTSEGTVMVKNINAGSNGSGIQYLSAIGGMLYFRANDGIYGRELWKSDGTNSGTVLVKDINVGSGSSNPTDLTPVGSSIYFTANDGTNGIELWKSDGTGAGTALVKDVNVGSAGSDPGNLTGFEGNLYFSANDGTAGSELWTSNGTSTGTVMVMDIFVGAGSPAISYLTASADTLYFVANNGVTGSELWKSDGTAGGTALIKDINDGSGSSSPLFLTTVGTIVYFWAYDPEDGSELRKSDGTSAGTVTVRNRAINNISSNPEDLTRVGNTLFFRANDGVHGAELWKCDGTEGSTLLVEDIVPGFGSSNLTNLTALDNTLYFVASDGVNGSELWKSDGTEVGTVLVKDINAGSGSSNPAFLTAVGSILYFVANDGINGSELWKSDGTTEGTLLVKDIHLGSSGSSPAHLIADGNTIYFSAYNSTTGSELWKSDGTSAGTVQVKDIRAGISSSAPAYLSVMENALYFVAEGPTNGEGLWKSDGTDIGTVLVKDFNDAGVSSDPAFLTAVENILFFRVNDGANGYELWKSDGTTGGTVLVKDIVAGIGSSSPLDLTAVGNTLFFRAYDPASGAELWKSDGTASGTVRVKDIRVGSSFSDPANLTAVESTLFFVANDGINGSELWKSDGTNGGTVMVANIVAGSGSSDPDILTAVESTLYFNAQTEESGRELWVLRPPGPPSVTNPSAISVSAETAILGGNVTSDGGSAITERGVVWSVNSNNNDPYVDDPGVTKVVATGSTGVFTVPVTGLSPATTYVYRAYAVNSEGVSYSDAETFLTLSVNANLSSIVLSETDLAPAFNSATTSYTSNVSNATQSLTVTAARAEEFAILEIGVNDGAYAPLTSGSASAPLPLSVGPNSINFRVTAQAGNTRTYSVTVIRDKATQTIAFNHPGPRVANAPFTLAATGGGSGNAVTFTVEGPCQIVEGDVLVFTGTGLVTVRANQAGNDLYRAASEVAHTFSVSAASASVSISDTIQVYTGSPRSVTVTTTPPNLAHSVTYSGQVETPVDAGNYQANVTITDPRYSGSGTANLQIRKATQAITFHPLGNQSVEEAIFLSATGGNSGEPVSFSVTSGPASITGNQVTFSGAGTVQITATQAGNQNYDAAAPVMQSFNVTLSATVHHARLHQVADGSAREVIVATDPPGLATETTYNGSNSPPLLPGSYAVETSVTDPDYEGNTSNTLVVDDPARFVTVTGGTISGVSALGPLHEATFQIAVYETIRTRWVTVATWAEANAGYDFDENFGSSSADDTPITGISWYEAAKWCNALTEWENSTLGRNSVPAYRVDGNTFKSGTPESPTAVTCDFTSSGYRLPTSTEWEFAARGGSAAVASIYPGGDNLDLLGWFAANSDGSGPFSAGSKGPNNLGLHDFAGNAAEWTWDAPAAAQTQRILRGGSWQSLATECRLDALTSADPSIPTTTAGFRVTRSVELALVPALDQNSLSWNSGGDSTWLAQNLTTNDASDAAESVLSSPGQSSWVETTVSGPCNLRFHWKSTGESTDLIALSVDGQPALQGSGNSEWSEQLVELSAGDHILRWTHTRSSNTGSVFAWLDTVSVEPTMAPAVSTDAAEMITNDSANLGGEVSDGGGRNVTNRGVVYDITPMPNHGTSHELASTTGGTGAYTVTATNLIPGTTYYVRAYAINNVGTGYGQEIIFTAATPVGFDSGLADYERSILPGDSHVFTFILDGPRIVNLSTTGGAPLRVILLDGSGNAIASQEGNENFAITELLRAGAYSLEISRLPGAGEAQNYHLDIDASEVAASRPDVSVGPTANATTGRHVYLPSGQTITLPSKKARPVTGYAMVANRGNLPDALSVSGSGANGFFAVSYFAPGGNVTAQLLAGTFRTSELEPNDSEEIFRVVITPNKKKLVTKKRKGITIRRKSLTLPITSTSTVDPTQRDTASFNVKVL